jgi:hypothetical protein
LFEVLDFIKDYFILIPIIGLWIGLFYEFFILSSYWFIWFFSWQDAFDKSLLACLYLFSVSFILLVWFVTMQNKIGFLKQIGIAVLIIVLMIYYNIIDSSWYISRIFSFLLTAYLAWIFFWIKRVKLIFNESFFRLMYSIFILFVFCLSEGLSQNYNYNLVFKSNTVKKEKIKYLNDKYIFLENWDVIYTNNPNIIKFEKIKTSN